MIQPTIHRAKRKDNGIWIEGQLIVPDILLDDICLLPHVVSVRLGENSIAGFVPVDESTLGRQTGLNCTKGKYHFIGLPIWEHDVFRREDEDDEIEYLVVMWIPQRAAFYMVPAEHYPILLDNDCSDDPGFSWLFQDAALYDFSIDCGLAKVGNVHDNPEFLI